MLHIPGKWEFEFSVVFFIEYKPKSLGTRAELEDLDDYKSF